MPERTLNIELAVFEAGLVMGTLYRAVDEWYAKDDPIGTRIRRIAKKMEEQCASELSSPGVDPSKVQLVSMNEVGLQPQMAGMEPLDLPAI